MKKQQKVLWKALLENETKQEDGKEKTAKTSEDKLKTTPTDKGQSIK